MADQNTFGIAGLLGWPVAHSRSPVIHNHWLAHYRIPGRYVLFPVPPEKLGAAGPGMAVPGLGGRHVTPPPKRGVFPLLVPPAPPPRQTGAGQPGAARKDGRLARFL